MQEYTVTYPQVAQLYQDGVLTQEIYPDQEDGLVRFFVPDEQSFIIIPDRDAVS